MNWFLRKGLFGQSTSLILKVLALQVIVKFFTSLREIVGKKEDPVSFGGNEKVSVAKVLGALTEKYGENFRDYVFDKKTGKPQGHLQFLINGTSTATLAGLETELKDGDVLAILPPVGGG
jgi:sulfur-carrier protein